MNPQVFWKCIVQKLLLLAILLTSHVSYGVFKWGEHTNIFFVGSISNRFETNIFRDDIDKTSDYVLILSPGIEAVFGSPNGKVNASVFYKADIFMHAKNTKLDHEDNIVKVDLTYRSPKQVMSLYGSYIQVSQNTPDVNTPNQLIRHTSSTVGFNEVYIYSPKTTFEVGYEFKRINFRTRLPDVVVEILEEEEEITAPRNLVDRVEHTVPLAIYYQFSPKLEIGPSYRYVHTDLHQRKGDFNDHFYGIGIRGQLEPRVVYTVHIGGEHRLINNTKDCTTFATRTSVEWEATDKILVALQWYRDFGAGGFGDSILDTGAAVRVDYKIADKISTYGRVSYNNASYQTSIREDDTVQAQYDVSYHFKKYFTLVSGYIYQNNISNRPSSGYSNHIAYLNVNARY